MTGCEVGVFLLGYSLEISCSILRNLHCAGSEMYTAVLGRHSFLESAGFLMPLGSFILHISTEHLVHARHGQTQKTQSL